MKLKTAEDIRKYCGETVWITTKDGVQEVLLKEVNQYKDTDANECAVGFKYKTGNKEHLGFLCCYQIYTEAEEASRGWQDDMNNTEVCISLGGDTVGIYKGAMSSGMTQLPNESFHWKDAGEDQYITLADIRRQALEKGLVEDGDMMTVFQISPLEGKIYVCGNYSRNDWVLNGTTRGFA